MTFYIKLGLIVAAILAFFAFKHHYDEGIRDEVRSKEVLPLKAEYAQAKADWEADKQQRLHAYTEMATKWVVAQQEAERSKKEVDDERAKHAAVAKARVAAIPKSVADVRVPLVAGVLNDDVPAVGGSNSAAPPTAGQPEHGAAPGPATADDTTVGLWAGWSVQMKDLYQACRDQIAGTITFYNRLRAQQQGVQP